MATEAAWLNADKRTEGREEKTGLTRTGLLMEGVSADYVVTIVR